jgi:hypothetical protein
LFTPLFGQPAKLAVSLFPVGAYRFLDAPVPAAVKPVSDNGWLRSESPSPETLGALIHFVLLTFLVSVMWRSNWPAGSSELSEAAGNARIFDFSVPRRRMNSGLRPAQGQRAVGIEIVPSRGVCGPDRANRDGWTPSRGNRWPKRLSMCRDER